MTVLAKCDHTLPTGSYKDRGAALLMSYLHALGIEGSSRGLLRQRRGRPSRVRSPRQDAPQSLLSGFGLGG